MTVATSRMSQAGVPDAQLQVQPADARILRRELAGACGQIHGRVPESRRIGFEPDRRQRSAAAVASEFASARALEDLRGRGASRPRIYRLRVRAVALSERRQRLRRRGVGRRERKDQQTALDHELDPTVLRLSARLPAAVRPAVIASRMASSTEMSRGWMRSRGR